MIDFAEIRSTTQARLKNILARVVFGGTTGTDAGAQMVPPAAADEGEEGAEVWQQWGFASRPKPSLGVIEALVVAIEDGLAVIATRQQRTQVALAEGEAVFYCAATGCTVKLTAAGKVEISGATGQDVVFNGGNLKVARESDPVRVTIPTGTSLAMTIPGVGAVTATTTSPVTCNGTVTNGAPHLKA